MSIPQITKETGLTLSLLVPLIGGILWVQSSVSGLRSDIRVLESRVHSLIPPQEIGERLARIEVRLTVLEQQLRKTD